MMTSQSAAKRMLNYASRQVQVIRRPDGFVLLIPPPSWILVAVHSAILLGTGLFCIIAVFWPTNGDPERNHSVAYRILIGIIGCVLLLALWNVLAKRTLFVVIIVAGRKLICELPGIRGITTRTYDLDQFEDAAVTFDGDGSASLRLYARQSEVQLLSAGLYREMDLRCAAEMLREAIVR